jgi:hypothetical protein
MRPTCLVPQPQLSPHLQPAFDGAVELLADSGSRDLRQFFTPGYLAHFPDTLGFLEQVRSSTGPCAWRCLVKLDGTYKATGLLSCEKRTALLTVGVEPVPPYGVAYFSITKPPVPP